MNLDGAVGLLVWKRLWLSRDMRAMSAEQRLASADHYNQMRQEWNALSLVISAAQAHQACEARSAAIKRQERPRYKDCEKCGIRTARHFNYRHKCLPRQVAPFMFECPGCLQHFGRGKGPHGLARHCCRPSHPQMRRAR